MKKSTIAFYLIMAVELWFIFFWKHAPRDRVRACDLCVFKALETGPKLPEFYRYADDLDYWFTPDRPRGNLSSASCSYGQVLIGPFRRPDIYVYIDADKPEYWQDTLNSCVFHEIGHYIDDRLGNVSDSDEFKQAVELSILMWQNLPQDKVYVWQWVGERIATFPGINGNPVAYEYWGGYKELYADLHDISYLSEVPPPLRKYFDDFIPWSP